MQWFTNKYVIITSFNLVSKIETSGLYLLIYSLATDYLVRVVFWYSHFQDDKKNMKVCVL